MISSKQHHEIVLKKKHLKITELRIFRTPGYLELFSQSHRVRDNDISLYLKHLLEANKSLAYDILVETWYYNQWVKNLNTCSQKLGFPQFYHIIPNLNSYKLSLPHIIQRIGDITLQEQRSKVRESEKTPLF
jgi:hypothetical protein